MSDFKRFPRNFYEGVHKYADVERSGIDGLGTEHAVVRVPAYYDKDAGMALCMIHLPKRANERLLEKVCSRQHYEIIQLKERIAYLEAILPA